MLSRITKYSPRSCLLNMRNLENILHNIWFGTLHKAAYFFRNVFSWPSLNIKTSNNPSRGKWSNLGQSNKKFKKFVDSNKLFKVIEKFRNFPTFQGIIHETNLTALGSFKWPNSYFLCAKWYFSYTQVVAFAFVLQGDFSIFQSFSLFFC